MTSESHGRILIVDDDSDIRQMLSTALAPHGLTVDVAGDGARALDLLRQNNYAVVLLDLLMPGVDGFGVLDAMHAESLQSQPIVLVIIFFIDVMRRRTNQHGSP